MRKITIDELKAQEVFKTLKKETLDALVNNIVVTSFEKNSHVFRDKEKVDTVYIVLSGKFSLYKLGENSNKKIIYILGAGKILNDVILDNLAASINCEAFEAGELIAIKKSELLDIMSRDFELTKIIVNSLTIKVRRLYRQLKNTTPLKIEKRVAAKLWKLCKDYGVDYDDGALIDMRITVTYLADMFGSQRETISRALKQLEELNLIEMREKKIFIINKEKLLKYFKGL
ncbi:Crp/Fnr family transcriptional regulator [Clostridium sp. 'White wine YQ']|uniref:Crp/Fnr family transcriptional regulator n=1 Tax=Clostridium sp. 'White wine YQ' TaxID=3027474 RepID=UPI0023667C30|nr:Crp/Fnr family transcriptional regulator [Clostridium sp. 'White wine YQ']MDD7796183.1 Crp/Fnr family transcriptional regulator [Clostridium sp. 'White wine YQ']